MSSEGFLPRCKFVCWLNGMEMVVVTVVNFETWSKICQPSWSTNKSQIYLFGCESDCYEIIMENNL